MGRALRVFPFIHSSKNPIIRFMFWLRPVARIERKTHDRFQPWVLVKTWLRSTSANGVGDYDDDQNNRL
jgi:hypothetical protein